MEEGIGQVILKHEEALRGLQHGKATSGGETGQSGPAEVHVSKTSVCYNAQLPRLLMHKEDTNGGMPGS